VLLLESALDDAVAQQIALRRATGLGLRRPSRAYDHAKRVLDVALCLLFAPLLILAGLGVAAAIRLGDGGPVFYSQMRTGRDGRRFRIYKFRTMTVGADAATATSGVDQPTIAEWFRVKPERDPRVTRVGRVLRKTYADELPQLINVLRGEMSLVGPRPYSLPSGSFELWQTERFEVQPGLTCLWQALPRRDEMAFDDRLRLDLKYLETCGLVRDLGIIAVTLRNSLRRNGR
jgi:lipopolysaccharide/colanic/teichoic acid biosynthesis glycosyltransferase